MHSVMLFHFPSSSGCRFQASEFYFKCNERLINVALKAKSWSNKHWKIYGTWSYVKTELKEKGNERD